VSSSPKTRLIYLPGIDGTGRLLHRQPRLFEQYDVRCISYPQDRPNTYAELVALGASQLEPDGGIVLSESFGGGVALQLALERPDLVKQLVLVNTFAYFPRRPLIQLLAGLGRLLPSRPVVTWSRPLRARFFFPPDTPPVEFDTWWEKTADVPMSAYGQRFRLITRLDLRAELSRIAIPAIVFTAPNDPIVPPPAGRLLAKLLPNARLIERPAGHAAMIHPSIDVAAWLCQPPLAG